MKPHQALLLLLTAIALILAAAPAGARIVDKIIVIVNDEVITYSELEQKLNPIILRLLNERAQVTPELKKRALDELIRTRLVMQEAAKRQLQVSDGQIDARVGRIIQELRANFLDDREFADSLRENGITLEQLRAQYAEQARQELLQQMLFAQELGTEVEIDEDEVRREYHLRHILCLTEEDANVAKAKLEKGVDFALVATYESKDPHAAQGGDWGYLRLGTLPEEVDIVLVGLKEGETSGIIHHEGGYSLIQLVGTRKLEPNEMSAAEVKALSDHMRILKIYSRIEAWQQKLWDNSYVEIKDRF